MANAAVDAPEASIPTFYLEEAVDRETFASETLAHGRFRVAGLLFAYTGFSWALHEVVMFLFFPKA